MNAPLYDEYIPGYPSIQDEEFYNRIVEKKEFWDGQDDMFFRHQANLARYLAQWTLYEGLFVYHEMGTGKSALTVAMTELAKKNTMYKKVVYIAHNQTQISNYKNEILRFSTRLSFLFQRDKKSVPEDKWKNRWNSILSKDQYEFYTFGTVASEFSKRTDTWIKDHYEKSIFLIDEAHHLVQTHKEEDKKSYHTIVRFLSILNYKKVLVMSGTPIRDQPDEIVPLLNLILPPHKQLSRTDFLSSFFHVKEHVKIFENVEIPLYEWKPNGRHDFINHIQGYVSYVKRRQSNAIVRYEGRIYEPMNNIKIVAHRMEPFQNSSYTEVFRKERWGEESETSAKSSFYSSSKQASLFVFPNGEIGEKGYKKFATPQLSLRKNFLESLGDDYTTDEVLDWLKQFSVSYACVIQHIVNNPKELVYVFSDLVEGSGILLFMILLKTLFKFQLITSKKDLVDVKGDRMILLNDRVANEDDFQDFIQYFNRPENRYGEYCQIVMSTNKTKEGISLKNVRQIHILTPSWNIADTAQAMARSLRARSHDDLEEPVVRIFLHVSVPFIGEEEDEEKWLAGKTPITRDELLFSVDYQRYYRSEIKERNAKLLDRVFLESSWDCLMNIPHNTGSGRTENYSRECEYDVCQYRCYGISEDADIGSDVSNYNAYYQGEEEMEIINRIQDYFSTHSRVRLSDFYQVLPTHNRILVEECLSLILYKPLVLRDYRHMPCFLAYKNGVLFLTDNPYLPVSQENYDAYYQQFPATRVVFPLPSVLDSYFVRHQKTILPKLVRLIQTDSPNAKNLFLSLPIGFQEVFCETIIQSKVLYPTRVSIDPLPWFVKEFKTDIQYVPNVLIRHRFLPDKKQHKQLNLKDPAKGWTISG